MAQNKKNEKQNKKCNTHLQGEFKAPEHEPYPGSGGYSPPCHS